MREEDGWLEFECTSKLPSHASTAVERQSAGVVWHGSSQPISFFWSRSSRQLSHLHPPRLHPFCLLSSPLPLPVALLQVKTAETGYMYCWLRQAGWMERGKEGRQAGGQVNAWFEALHCPQ